MHVSCALACLSYTVPSRRLSFHGDAFPHFALTNPEEKFKRHRALLLFLVWVSSAQFCDLLASYQTYS